MVINLTWETKKPIYGDHIRVNRGFYAHHGIYAADDCVIHFASLNQLNRLDPASARIIVTSLEDFLQGGCLEVACYNSVEQEKRRTRTQIVNQALLKVGECGYDLISNNCEHFANECEFGYKKSSQVQAVFNTIFGGKK